MGSGAPCVSHLPHRERVHLPEIELPTKHLPPLRTFRILTLEDADNIEKLKIACKEAGHQVVPATTITLAMDFLKTKDHVDVIIAAAHLQSESIFEFLKQVKATDSHLHAVPFVMLSSDPGFIATITSPAIELAANLMGADKYLLMTEFDAERLMKEIEPLFPAIPRKELDSA
jgi:PleD family two-component response regulator